MPHSQENAEGVHKTGIGFMVNKQIVDFGEDDGEQKVAKLFFTLAACNPDEHMNNIEQLTQIFMNEPLLDALMAATTPEEILEAEAKYPFEDDYC
jgi:PTS system ascorbate-specific IIA component